MSQDWLTMTASDLGRGIESGQIDPVALTEAYLDAIQAHQFAERIYVRATAKRAHAEAAAASERAKLGLRRSRLDGVPISWKDLFDTARVETEAGSAFLKGRIPLKDARVVENATSAGLICLGKTHMTEHAFSGIGLNPVTASPPNVNDHDAASGGSSSGAATSVAFGLAAAGIGSDTGGSVRVPSAWNDLVGLKTTHGRLSLEGVVPLCARFDTVGPLCRSVEDAALLLSAMEGANAPDLGAASLAGRRFLVLQNVALEDVEDAPLSAFELALSRLKSAGADVIDATIPQVNAAMDLAPVLFATEAYGTWKDEIEAHPELMFEPVRDRFRGGAAFSGADYVKAWQQLDRLRNEYHDVTAPFDAVLMPTCPILPPKLADLEADQDFFIERNLKTLRNTRIGNLMGSAGVTLPTGVPSCGILLQGPPGSESRLLRLAKAAETALA